jgi:hypothetical protein
MALRSWNLGTRCAGFERWDQDHRIHTTSERPEGLCIAPLSSDAHTHRLILYRLIHLHGQALMGDTGDRDYCYVR